MLTAEQQAEAERKLKLLASEQETEKNIKNKIKNVSKNLNDKLKALAETDPKKASQILAKFNENYLAKFLTSLETKNQVLLSTEEKLKSQKDQLNREKINALEDKERFNRAIVEIKETIVKIQKAIEESVKQQADKRKDIQEGLDKSIAEIKEKITTFEKESEELDKENEALRAKKEEILKKMSGLEDQFKAKASEKDEVVKKDKQDLLSNLKQVENQLAEATELNKQFGALEKKNFDNKLSIYLRTKKFPEICNSMQSSATTIDKCKHELTKGVQRILKAQEIVKNCEVESKEINEQCIGKLKLQEEKLEKLKQIKAEKEKIRERILELQSQKKQREAIKNTTQ